MTTPNQENPKNSENPKAEIPPNETPVQKLKREYEESLEKPHPIRWFIYIVLSLCIIYAPFFDDGAYKAYGEKSSTLPRIIAKAFANFRDQQTIHAFLIFLQPLSLACLLIYIYKHDFNYATKNLGG